MCLKSLLNSTRKWHMAEVGDVADALKNFLDWTLQTKAYPKNTWGFERMWDQIILLKNRRNGKQIASKTLRHGPYLQCPCALRQSQRRIRNATSGLDEAFNVSIRQRTTAYRTKHKIRIYVPQYSVKTQWREANQIDPYIFANKLFHQNPYDRDTGTNNRPQSEENSWERPPYFID